MLLSLKSLICSHCYKAAVPAVKIKHRLDIFSKFVSCCNKTNMEYKHMTRGGTVKEEKEKFLSMGLDEKRKMYKCNQHYVQLDNVATWQNYFLSHQGKLRKPKCNSPKFDPCKELNQKVSIWKGDITHLEIDGIVNAANNSLLGGGGVDGAIHLAAGSMLRAECETLHGCETGDAKITAGYKLPAKYIIHTVGPVGVNRQKLESAYNSCLDVAHKNGLKSFAFPCISTGVYGYPSEKAAHVAIESVRNFLTDEKTGKNIDRIIFCLFLPVDVKIYEELLQLYFPVEFSSAKTETQLQDSATTEIEQAELLKKETHKTTENPSESQDTKADQRDLDQTQSKENVQDDNKQTVTKDPADPNDKLPQDENQAVASPNNELCQDENQAAASPNNESQDDNQVEKGHRDDETTVTNDAKNCESKNPKSVDTKL